MSGGVGWPMIRLQASDRACVGCTFGEVDGACDYGLSLERPRERDGSGELEFHAQP